MTLPTERIADLCSFTSEEKLEIRCHYGHEVLEIAECWRQDGDLIVTVFAKPSPEPQVPTEDAQGKL